jgi:hypothetical protein
MVKPTLEKLTEELGFVCLSGRSWLLEQAEREEVVLLASNLPAYETVGKLYNYLENRE